MADPTNTNSNINQRFQLITRRADRADDQTLVDTFVSIGGVENILLNPENQIILGRRGTGKTHALRFLHQKATALRAISIFIDIRQLGSDGSIYTDTSIPIAPRIARVVTDFFGAVHEVLLDTVTHPDVSDDIVSIIGELDRLADAIAAVRVDESFETETERSHSNNSGSNVKAGLDIGSASTISIGASSSKGREKKDRILERAKGTKNIKYTSERSRQS